MPAAPDGRCYSPVLHVGAGRGFPPAPEGGDARLLCVASFAGEARRAGLSSAAGAPGSPAWDARLEWRLSAAQLRSLEAAGGHCKVSFARPDGRVVGWAVCGLREARLNGRQPGRRPAWWALGGPFKSRDAPEVQLHPVLAELPAAERPIAATTSAGEMPAAPAAPELPAEGRGGAGDAPLAAGSADETLLAAAGALSSGLVADGSQRRFALSLDLRGFTAGRRLPLNLASVVVQLSLPPELAGGRAALPARPFLFPCFSLCRRS